MSLSKVSRSCKRGKPANCLHSSEWMHFFSLQQAGDLTNISRPHHLGELKSISDIANKEGEIKNSFRPIDFFSMPSGLISPWPSRSYVCQTDKKSSPDAPMCSRSDTQRIENPSGSPLVFPHSLIDPPLYFRYNAGQIAFSLSSSSFAAMREKEDKKGLFSFFSSAVRTDRNGRDPSMLAGPSPLLS